MTDAPAPREAPSPHGVPAQQHGVPAPHEVPATAAGIVADDLTGAADSAVQFARSGWTARLALGGDAPSAGGAGSVVAVVTDSRALDAEEAHAVTAAAVHDLARAGTERVFVKIDSTMRGSVSSQVAGALEAWRTRHPGAVAVVAPAYPALGRTVEGGRLLVDGVGVERTSVGRDPVTPVATSVMTELLPGSVVVAVDGDDAAAVARRLVGVAASGADVVVVDAADDDELEVVARAVVLLGARAVPVGSAGLAVPVGRAWGSSLTERPSGDAARPRHVVVVLSSLHDASRSQYDHLLTAPLPGAAGEASGPRVVAPTLAEVLAGDLEPALLRAGSADGAVTVVLAPAREGDDDGAPRPLGTPVPEARATPGADGATGAGQPTAASGPDLGTPTGATVAERVADALAELADRVVHDLDDVALVLVGGEGARAVLRRVGAESVLVRGAVREGVPWGTLEGGRLHGTPVVTKAGGFGPVTTLADVVPDLLRHPDQNVRSAPQGETP